MRVPETFCLGASNSKFAVDADISHGNNSLVFFLAFRDVIDSLLQFGIDPPDGMVRWFVADICTCMHCAFLQRCKPSKYDVGIRVLKSGDHRRCRCVWWLLGIPPSERMEEVRTGWRLELFGTGLAFPLVRLCGWVLLGVRSV